MDKYFDKIITEIINDIKNENNYKRKFDFSSGVLKIGDDVYQKVIDNFNYLQNFITKQKFFDIPKDFFKHDLKVFLRDLGVIYPIKNAANGKLSWI